MHELADRLRAHRTSNPRTRMEIHFDQVGLVKSATLIEDTPCKCFDLHHCSIRTKVV